MFRYKVGTVRLFGTQENLSLVRESLGDYAEAKLTSDYLQFVLPKSDIAEFENNFRELCDDGQYTGAILWKGVQYGQPFERIFVSYNSDNWDRYYESLKKYGFVEEYFTNRNKANSIPSKISYLSVAKV